MACIYFHPDGFTTAGRQVMGRHVAGESFLSAYLRYACDDNFALFLEDESHLNVFNDLADAEGVKSSPAVIKRSNYKQLSSHQIFFKPGPNLSNLARQRSLFGDSSWSLCGITHTISSDTAMDQIVDLTVAPLQPWDALICTSSAVKNSVEVLLRNQINYIANRFQAKRCPLPQLPVIPLGVDQSKFKFSSDFRRTSRRDFGIGIEDIVVLYVGRLSFHAKANPCVMYESIQQAARSIDGRVVLIECGWFYNDYILRSFNQARQYFSPNIDFVSVDGRQPELLQRAWAAADIFCSFSDNIQETFGITPIEAMASGLPVVVSNWNGYKDTVRDGIDGFSIPTSMPAPSLRQNLGRDLGVGTIDYDLYLGLTALQVTVSLEHAVRAFRSLFESKALRLSMGENARKSVAFQYDWSVIIPQYNDLWLHLSERRNHKAKTMGLSPANPFPARPDPFELFKNYPSSLMNKDSNLRLFRSSEDSLHRLNSILSMKMFSPYSNFFLDHSLLVLIVEMVNDLGMVTVESLYHSLAFKDPIKTYRSIAFLIKVHILIIEEDLTRPC